MKVLIASPISDSFRNYLSSKKIEMIDYKNSLENISAYTGIITSNKLLIDKTFLDEATNLRWIARMGSGLEIIDIEYAHSKNIYCCSSPAGIANAVAEHVVALLIGLQKNVFVSANQVKNHDWIREPNRGLELEGKTIGLFGYGNTGSKTAQKLCVFGCNIIAYDPFISISDEYTTQVSLQTIYQQADVVSLHLPLNATTTHFYKPKNFAKPHIFINTSRGNIASTLDVLAGLSSGMITACGLDVLDFEQQIPFNDANCTLLDSLLRYNTVITPHIAGYSFNAIDKMSNELLAQLKTHIFTD